MLMGLMIAAPSFAQTAPATITYHFERPGLPIPSYTYTLHEDGSGSFKGMYQPAPAKWSTVAAPAMEMNIPLTLSAATAEKVFEAVRSTDHFHSRCESKAKNIADTGTKTIDYTGADGHATCTYNYTENKAVQSVTETFAAITTTLDMGRQLDFNHRYDRLGLDALMNSLMAAVKDKNAIEVQLIAPTLQSIATDGAVIERVRVAAGKLLQMTGK
jgi:hypothetical protein